MRIFERYDVIEQLYTSERSLVYKVFEPESEKNFILKIQNQSLPNTESTFRKEYEHNLIIGQSTFINSNLELIEHDSQFAIVEEYIPAEPLDKILKTVPLSIETCLSIATKTAHGLRDIHKAGIIHKDINTSNIIFNPDSGVCKIIDFGLSSRMTRESMGMVAPDQLEGTLAYISPEQTGRMNRSIDYRSDFYSLGVTIYELLTGKLPFVSSDPLELVHAHIAKIPQQPHDANPSISPVLSEIVMKLLEKNAENRYQSSEGLIADLDECQKQLSAYGTIDSFEIAQSDISYRLNIPQKLYGRDTETKQLKLIFQQVCNGDSKAVLVSGEAGIGKTALISELYQPIIEYGAWYTTGKFEQYSNNQPYAAISQFLDKLLTQLLTLSNNLLEDWKQKIRAALGRNGKVIAEISPLLEIIVGEFPAIEILPPLENQNRFEMVFFDFIKLFISADKPLVVFIDDLHWADYASLRLLKTILLENTAAYFFFIGAYRPKEAQANNEFIKFIEQIKTENSNIPHLALKTVGQQAVTELIAQTLRKDVTEVEMLPALVQEKTGGNPFYIKQFLENLHSNNLLYIDTEWKWDIEQIAKASVTINVADMLVAQLYALPKPALEILQILSSIGGCVPLTELSKITEKTTDIVKEHLLPAINDGYINIKQNCLEFAHDKIQETVYMQIEPGIRQKIHHTVSKMWMQTELNKSVFSVVAQLYKAKNLLSETEKTILSTKTILASEKAKQSNAFSSAVDYINIAIELLPEQKTMPADQQNFDLFIEKASLLYLCSEIEQAHALINSLLRLENISNLQSARLLKIRLNCLTAENKAEQVLKEGAEAARLLGVELPEMPTIEIVMDEYAKTDALLQELSDTELIEYRASINTAQDELGNLFFAMLAMIYMNRPLLFPILAFKIIQQGIENGFCSTTGFGFGVYCVFKYNIGQKKEARKYSEIGVKLAQRFKNGTSTSFCLFMQMCVLQPFESPQAIEQRLKNGMNFSLEKGDIEYASYNLFYIAPTQISKGLSLLAIAKELNQNLVLLDRLKQTVTRLYVSIYQQFFENVLEATEPNHRLSGSFFDEETVFLKPECKNDINLRLHYSFPKLLLNLLFEKYEESIELISFIEQNTLTFESQPYAIADKFIICLIYTALYPASEASEQESILKKLEQYLTEFKNYLNLDPLIHYNKYCLIQAEWNRIKAAETDATLTLYDKAISTARKCGYLYEEAIALERASAYYREKGIVSIADDYITKAFMCYEKWGCKPKLHLLEKQYTNLWRNSNMQGANQQTVFTSTKGNNTHSYIDVGTIIKATQAISGETDMQELLEKMIAIATENAGADRGVLILKQNGEGYCIEAEIDVTKNQTELLQSVPLKEFRIPLQLIQYVINTKKAIVLGDASHEGDFTNDAYIAERKLKSAIGMPILHQNKLTGIFYLENNLLTNAFRPDRAETLKAIATQAAISIENARLVEKLKAQHDEILAQNEEYEVLNDELTQTNINLEKAKNKAEESDKLKTEFFQNMSHEIRSPLNGILGFTSFLDDPDVSIDERATYIQYIRSSGQQLLHIIEDILEITRLSTKQVSLAQEQFNANDMIKEICLVNEQNANKKNVLLQFKNKLSENKAQIISDPSKLRRILNNLVENAVKFTFEGEITVNCQILDENLLDISVADTGIGIQTDKLESVFERFSQEEKELSRKTGGLGLGLAIAQENAKLLGGKLKVTSQKNKGSVFSLQFPYQPAKEEKTYKILVAEDEELNFSFIEALLKRSLKLNCTLLHAKNGQVAVEMFEKEKPFDLVLMDMKMPLMNGFVATEKIREIDKNMPIIAQTAFTSNEDKQKASAAGCNDFISKPIDRLKMKTLLDQYLQT